MRRGLSTLQAECFALRRFRICHLESEYRIDALRRERMLRMKEKYIEKCENEGPWTVALHRAQQMYGGPAEGGWYYVASEPIAVHRWRTFSDKKEANDYAAQLGKIANRMNRGLPPIWSVLSDGVYEVRVQPGDAPYAWPLRRPHYE